MRCGLLSAAKQSDIGANRLEKETSQKEEAQNKYKGVYDDFDKTHEIN